MAGIGTLQVLDPDDLALGTETILFDCHDETGVANVGGVATLVREFVLGNVGVSASSADEKGSDGQPEIVYDADETVEMSWRQRFFFTSGASYDKMVLAAGRLGRFLLAGGVLKWIPDGSTNVRYIYFDPSPVPALLQSPESMFRALTSFDTGAGLEIRVTRRRRLAWPALDGTINKVLNPTLLLWYSTAGSTFCPDGWLWSSIPVVGSQAIDPAEESYKFQTNSATTRKLRSWFAAAAVGQVWSGQIQLRSDLAGSTHGVEIEFLSADRSTVLATNTPALIAVPLTFPKDSTQPTATYTAPAAPASTAYVRINIVVTTPDATVRTFRMRRAQLEIASAPTMFRVGEQSVSNDLQPYLQGPSTAPTAALVVTGSGNVDNGTHSYKQTHVAADGTETTATVKSNVVTVDATHKQVTVTLPNLAIAVPAARAVARRIYRTKAGDAGSYYLLATVEITTNSYTDNTSDANLGVVEPDRNTTGAVGGRLVPIFVPGDAPAYVDVDVTPDNLMAGTQGAVQIVDVLTSRAISDGVDGKHRIATLLQRKTNGPSGIFIQGEDFTAVGLNSFSGRVSNWKGSSSVPVASPPIDLIYCTFATNPTVMDWRVRWDISDADLTGWMLALAETGRFRVSVRVCADVLDSVFALQLRYGLASGAVVSDALDEKPWDVSDYAAGTLAAGKSLFEVPLGTLELPPGVQFDGLRFELWARRDSGTAELDIDGLIFQPADRHADSGAPLNAMQIWLGRQLVTPTSPAGFVAGTDDEDVRIFDANNEGAGTPPNAGMDFGTNPQYVEFDTTASEPDGAGAQIGIARIRNVTDGTNTATRKIVPDVKRTRQRRRIVIRFVPAAGKLYQAQIQQTVGTAGYKLRANRIVRRDQPTIATMHSQPARNRADSWSAAGVATGKERFELNVEGHVPMILPPGLSLLYCALGEMPVAGQDDPVIATQLNRYATVRPTVAPASYH